MPDTEERTLYARMDKVDEMLDRDLSQSARYIWTKHARALKELRWQKAKEQKFFHEFWENEDELWEISLKESFRQRDERYKQLKERKNDAI